MIHGHMRICHACMHGWMEAHDMMALTEFPCTLKICKNNPNCCMIQTNKRSKPVSITFRNKCNQCNASNHACALTKVAHGHHFALGIPATTSASFGRHGEAVSGASTAEGSRADPTVLRPDQTRDEERDVALAACELSHTT